MEKLLISVCLLGAATRYDAKSVRAIDGAALESLKKKYELVPICPEIYGGLPTPRTPSERVCEKVIMKDGTDVTENYKKGADEALKLCELLGIKKALLKAKSPSCGRGLIYDGSFSGVLTEGNGVTAELLLKSGVEVFLETDIDLLIK